MSGVAKAAWNEEDPLVWTMSESAIRDGSKVDLIECDLRPLRPAYSDSFLLALKAALIEARHHKALISIDSDCKILRRLFSIVHTAGFHKDTQIERVDGTFVVALNAVAEQIPVSYIAYLSGFFSANNGDAKIFEPGLLRSDFPSLPSKRGSAGDRIDRILAKAFRRSTLVHILDVAEAAFEEGALDLGRFSFLKLALNAFCRPESYRNILLSDLTSDTDQVTNITSHFLRVSPAKTRVRNPKKLVYRLHADVGQILELQRASVVSQFGHLAPRAPNSENRELGKLALFPAMRLAKGGAAWVSSKANQSAGVIGSSEFLRTYLAPIRKLTEVPLSFIALRHTIGTQLAQSGCSAHTIQAVLKHASEKTCEAYIDIAFEGLIDELSDGLEPAFNSHFPVVQNFASKFDQIDAARRIDSEDLMSDRSETTGVCGRHVACQYAPIACYACPRFVPCFDADHSLNLDVVSREIRDAEQGGLAMHHEVKRWKTILNHIRVIMVACGDRRQAVELEAMNGASS